MPTPEFSATVVADSAMLVGASAAPVIVTSIVRLAEPSRLVTTSASIAVWPAFSAWVAARVLSSAYVQAPLVVLNVNRP